jgi:hypothetical protein
MAQPFAAIAVGAVAGLLIGVGAMYLGLMFGGDSLVAF